MVVLKAKKKKNDERNPIMSFLPHTNTHLNTPVLANYGENNDQKGRES